MEAEFQLINAPVITPDFRDADAPDVALIKRIPPSLKRPSMTYVQPAMAAGNKEAGFFASEYPLLDIGAAEDTDSYVYQAVFKKLALAMKEGWSLVGKNQETLDYIKDRFNQLEIAQGQTIRSMLIELMGSLLRYHSVFILKARNAKASGGKVRRIGNKKLNPVAGYFVASPDTMEIKPGKDYRPKAYKHVMPDGRKKFFKPEDVIHVTVNKKPHFLTPTPPWHPVIEDVTALRRIEEHIENLVYQHIYPLFQYKVGTEDRPMQRYEDGTTEADIVRAKIRDMPSDGMIVTPERHEIAGLGSESRALRADPYVEHFKKRVIAGTGMSQLDFGDGNTANRSCYSEDTQTLTENGWKYYWEIKEGERIATFNPQTEQLEFYEPNGGIYLHEYEGPMYHFKNRNVDVCVTPDHDMWVGQRMWKETEWSKQKAEEIPHNRFDFRTGSFGWEGIEPEDFKLPFVPYGSNIDFANSIDFDRIKIEDWLEFLGYFVSEGTLAKTKNKWAISISQSSWANPEKAERIRACFRRLPFKFNEYTDPSDGTTRFWINCKSLYLYLQENCGDYSYLKHFPSEVLSYSKEYLRIAFEAAMLGDGTTDRREGRTSRAYYSTSDLLIDQMQTIAVKLGYRAHVLDGASCKRVCISLGSKSEVKKSQIEVVQYSGKVYCFNVENHLFFTRRNGRIGVHGNTADSMSKLAVSNVKFYQQCLADFLNFHMIRELLQESVFGFDVLKEENKVEIQFAEIDHEASIARENHEMLRFTSNLTTRTEARQRSGMEPMSEEQEEDCYSCKVTQKEIEKKGDIELEKAKATASQRAAQNKSTPTNQHGTKTGPAKRKSARDMVAADLFHQLVQDLHRVNPRAVNLGFIEQLFYLTRDQIKRSFETQIRNAVISGTQGLPIGQSLGIRLNAIISRVQRDFESDVDRLFRASMSRTVAELSRGIRDRLTIDRLEYRIRFIERSILKKAETLGAVAAMQSNGIEQAVVRSVVGGEDYPIWNGVVIELNGVSDDQLPPYHPNCKCTLEPVGAPNGG